jgi:Opacity protein and related surface antigens
MFNPRSLVLAGSLAACCAGLSAPVSAAPLDTRVYVTPFANYTWTDDQLHAKDDFGYGIGFGKAINETVNLELNASHAEYKRDNGYTALGKVKDTGLMLDALYFLSRDPKLSPYAVLGVGGVQTRVPGDSSTNFAANAGVGVMTWLTDGVALRADARYRYIHDNADRNEGLVNVGLVIPFGEK